ncbi:hypothetical protein PROFUN_05024 [Planoprotostelium fungivorum]|uniref:GRIP domain-containing protein n=1 Tax=Planoprotostelium fungivorum TaxID=1890364 RepID=A0A2P6NS73_9EUKA|nr:hypothetical protein PROFUN_05024 [Planoprotostelium fungivorum]
MTDLTAEVIQSSLPYQALCFLTRIMQNERLKEQLAKSQKDLSRLKMHLMEVEELHTSDTIAKEDLITQLQQELIEVRKKQADQSIHERQQSHLQETIRQQQEQLAQSNEALSNLQNVLEQFQSDQQVLIEEKLSGLRKEVSSLKSELATSQNVIASLKNVGERCTAAESTVRSLQEEISQKTRNYIKLQEEVEPLRKAFEQTLSRLTSFAKNEENMIEKRMITSLLLSYFGGQANKKEVLELMSKLLGLSDQEKAAIGLTSRSSWSVIPFMGSNANKTVTAGEKNITDLWVDFLLQEAEKVEKAEQIQQQGSNGT